ncbi:MAG: DUF4010 domain-containing protein [Kiritimatiellae bacterium]|nr:DUF4010 domain-containing protein [Kiritimatiellia bacterium]
MTFELIRDLAIAIFIGALLGVEREKRIAEKGYGIGGIRTFILVAESGGVAMWLARALEWPWLFAAGLLAVAGLVLTAMSAQARTHGDHAGLTTSAAALSAYLLGGLAVAGEASLAVALAILNSAVMAYRTPLHELVGRLDRADLYAGLKLLIATFIVLPLLPNRAVDPWGVLNPYRAWWLVVLISGLSMVGYVAARWFGPQRGVMATGVFGGLVSSTAVTLSLARQSRADGEALAPAAAAGIAWSWAVMFVRIGVILAVTAPALFRSLWAGLVGAVVVCALGGAVLGRRAAARPSQEVPLRSPFSLGSAIKFAAMFVGIAAVVRLARAVLPGAGLLLAAALAGLTDVDAITLSLAESARRAADPWLAPAVLTAAGANTLVKCGMVAAGGAPAVRRAIGWLGVGLLSLLALAALTTAPTGG